MTLHLPRDLDERIREAARRAYPEECCGALIGTEDRSEGDDPLTVNVQVVHVEPLENTRSDERQRRYLIDPLALARLEHRLEDGPHDVVGIYHSHPDHPARPSDFDRTHAWPGLSYAIVAVAKGTPGELTSWRLAADRTLFHPEPLILHEAGVETTVDTQEGDRP